MKGTLTIEASFIYPIIITFIFLSLSYFAVVVKYWKSTGSYSAVPKILSICSSIFDLSTYQAISLYFNSSRGAKIQSFESHWDNAINSFFEIYSSLEQKIFLNDYRSNSCVLNREITVIKNNEESGKAVALDIDNDCRLLVRYENGSEEYLSSGEISIKM